MSSSHSKDFTFLGSRIPPEVESLSKNLKDVDQEMFRKILKGKHLSNVIPRNAVFAVFNVCQELLKITITTGSPLIVDLKLLTTLNKHYYQKS